MSPVVIYGANGYTGELVAREAVRRGLRPILAGRNGPAVEGLARELDLPRRVFALEEPAAIQRGLEGAQLVLHCAGPFQHTSRMMADACLRTKVAYLDITGEIAVFEALAARDHEARSAGVLLLPGVGFDVVPTDCLAGHLKRRLPTATHLALGLRALGRYSRGTATTIVESFPQGGVVRQGGRLTWVPAAWKTRRLDFGSGPVHAFTIPWGDVATAWYSTGIPNIEVYLAATRREYWAARLSRHFRRLLGAPSVQKLLKNRIEAGPRGPSAAQRQAGTTSVWGEATDPAGKRVVSLLFGPEGYTFTVLTALAVVERVLAGDAPPGFQTPARAYGADFVLGIAGVRREDVSQGNHASKEP